MYKIGDKVEYYGKVETITKIFRDGFIELDNILLVHPKQLKPYRTAHDKLIELGLTLKVTKNYAGGVFSHEWWNENDDRVIAFYIEEKLTTVYEGNNEIMAIIPQYLEELEWK